MSATIGRGDPRRPATDFYETPEWCTRAVCRWLKKNACNNMPWEAFDEDGRGTPMTILDPGAGSGAITRVLHREWPEAAVWAIEVDPKLIQSIVSGRAEPRVGVHCIDFLDINNAWPSLCPGQRFDLTVCNPPFSGPHGEDYALAFIKRAMSMSRVGAFLVRLNWLAAAPTPKKRERYEYLKVNPPCVLVLGKRPSFTGKGTDATEYCWLIWGVLETAGRWELLDAEV